MTAPGNSRKISFASTGATSRTPWNTPRARRRCAAAIAFDARAISSHSPFSTYASNCAEAKAHLRPHLSGAAQLHREPVGELGREHDDRVAQRAAVLGRAKRHDVDATAPGRLGRAAAEPRQRVGKRAPSMCNRKPPRLSPPRRRRGSRPANRRCPDRSPGSGWTAAGWPRCGWPGATAARVSA